MGNQPTKTTSQTYTQTYTQIQKQDHPFIGTITHLSHRPNNTKHILKIFKYATGQQLTQSLKKANKRKQLSQKKGSINILRTTQINTDKQNQLCGITNYLYIIYEDYNASLGDMIRMRAEQKKQFIQQDVLQMIRGVCNGLVFLSDNGYKNYTVTKESIVKGCNNQNNISNYKIFDTQFAKQLLPYPKLLNHISIQKGIYLPPQALLQLSNKNAQPDFSLKSDIFSLGMVALEMCTLQPLDYVYDYNRLKINNQKISQKIHNLKNYSPYFKSLLFEMLESNQEERIGAISLKQKINLNDAKSTTQYTYSGIGNSNITQRTHKMSYPSNNSLLLLNPQTVQQRNKIVQNQHHKKIQRILTFDQLKQQNVYPTQQQGQQPIDKVGNKTFQIGQRTHLIQPYDINQQRNKSLEKQRVPIGINIEVDEQRRLTAKPNANFTFYHPNHIKPMSVQVHQNYPIPRSPQVIIPATISPNLTKNTNRDLYPIPITSQTFKPITLNYSPAPPKLSQINIPQYAPLQKSQPQTPINNLNDSNAFINSQKLSIKGRLSNQEQDIVLNSLNPLFKKAQSHDVSQTDNLRKSQFQSPNRPQKSPMYASNESTPIRKVQALQSVARNSFDQIIKQTEQEDNEFQSNYIHKKNPTQENNLDLSAPKTYGKHHFTNGAIYEGEFDTQGNFCGNGVLYYPNGKVCYSGGWINNSFHGFGVLHNEHAVEKVENLQPANYQNFNLNNSRAWHHYEGEFYMDKKNGFGTLYMCTGQKFSGCFNKDMIEGYGTFTKANGQKVSGIWNQNILRKL